ncbi:hypothetical protein EDD70_3007 [Hydrogenoanaerobacterium saccharovorans]|uniref:Uncharacterized protein n=1 Tax=Hydrogenoanaerobacterium saccharovorans TaxID=474960 RepID=A0A1H8EHW0_9FIRM|nr:hypothetical protein [Hydrogenoanaerobacterium saccharovorans]RPF41881.1 hypothetical protein EDD70_3007 [Hydrogenoanaerobacterium saccharovorans]SEN19161.1 hypothetical protein SAMN05216180_3029 [Hydrogenoanaerobacterium saccharovorans]
MDYVAFDSSSIEEFFLTVYCNLGSATNIGLWIFLLVLGLSAVLGLIYALGG